MAAGAVGAINSTSAPRGHRARKCCGRSDLRAGSRRCPARPAARAAKHLRAVAREHVKASVVTLSPKDDVLAERVATKLMDSRKDAEHLGLRPPSTAEFLDAFRTLRQLGIGVDDERWEQIKDL